MRKAMTLIREEHPARTDSKAVVALVLGLLSFCVSIFAGIPAVIFGILSLGDIRKSGGHLGGKGLAIAGIVLGVVGTIYVIPYYLAIYDIFCMIERTKHKVAWGDTETIEKAVMAYKMDTGFFPDGLQTLTIPQNGRPAFLEPKQLIDPWGRPYIYKPQNLSPTGKPKIYSQGPPKANQPISNWYGPTPPP